MSAFTHIARRFIVPATGVRSDGLRSAFDIEANGLLGAATTVWCIVIIDLDSGQIYEYGPDRILDALAHLARVDVLIGHNITGYDLLLLEQLHAWRPKPNCAVLDTLIAGRLILPNITDLDDQAAAMGGTSLGALRGRYSLEAWGLRLGIPKVGVDIIDFSVWSPGLQARCVGDASLTKTLYHFLQADGYSRQAMELEHSVGLICNRITTDGVPFDVNAAERLRQQWAARRTELKAQLSQQFPGTNLNSRQQIGALLEARGWVPEKRTEKTGQPQIDDELLETIPAVYPEFVGLAEYILLGRRLGQLCDGRQAWCRHVDADGRIRGGLIHIGTPHSRAKHLSPNLAQVPNPKKGKPFATECRALFRAPEGWVFVTADQATLQDRGYAHYLTEFDGGAYASAFLSDEDQHWKTAAALGLISGDEEREKNSKLHAAIREGAKTFRYAFLFGCGAGRAGQIISNTVRAAQQIDSTSDLQQRFFGGSAHPNEATRTQIGRLARDKFIAATPGLQQLRASLEAQVRRYGWLPGLDGRRVPARALYSALNFIVTSSEAIICKRWLARVHDELCARFRYGWNGDVVIVLWIHDEVAVCCKPEIAEQVGEIMVCHAKEPGEHYGFRVPLDAEYKIGRSWAGEPVEAGAEAAAPELVPETAPAAAGSGEVPQEVSAGAEPAAVTEPAPETMSEIVVTPSEVMPAVDDDLHDGLGGDFDDDLGDDRHLDNVRLYDVDSALPSAAVPAGGPAEPAPPPSVDFGTLTPAPRAAETQPSKPNSAGAGATPSERAGGNGAARGNGYDGGGGKIFCPFHDDHTTPNLHIYADENDPHYHCFTCLAHGPLSELDDLGVDWRAAASTAHAQVDVAATLAYAYQLWGRARPILGTLAERYLVHVRGIDVGALPPDVEEVLRFHPSCPFNGGRHPCLLALFRDVETDEPAGIHRIALTPQAQKIERRTLGHWLRPRAIKLWSLIRLEASSRPLYLGEGIETTLAAATRLRDRGRPMQPAWAAGSSGNIKKFPIVPSVEELILLVDRDPSGEAAAAVCRQTWKGAGRRVRRLQTLQPSLNDFNDLVRAKLRAVS